MWFRELFYKCMYAFLSILSVAGGGALDYDGSWIYLIIGPLLLIPFVIGCIHIVAFIASRCSDIVNFIAFHWPSRRRKVKHTKVKHIITGREHQK